MTKSFFILVGASPTAKINTPGGQLTASKGLYDYAISQGHQLEIVDTLQTSFPIPPFRARLKRGLKRIYRLKCLLHTRKVKGVILFSAAGFSFYERSLMVILCRMYRVKTIFFMLSGFFVDDVESNRLKRVSAKCLLKLPNVVGVQGDAWRPFYKKLNVSMSRIVTIRNWLPPFFDELNQSVKQVKGEILKFCFVGWLVEKKGVNELFQAIHLLSKQYDFEFTFVGGGTLESKLLKLIDENELTHRVHVTGWVEPDEVRVHLSEAHVFVLPSKAEGFPNALLEAMAFGLPAICTNVGAVADSLFNDVNGYLLERGDAVSIAQAMVCYLNDPNLITRHSVEALNVVRELHGRDYNCKLLFDNVG
jgi:glycosyltransferase involved in cell wall biosynthesis